MKREAIQLLLCLQKLQGTGMEDGKKLSFLCFSADQKIASLWRKERAFFGILYHEQQVIACGQTHSDYGL